MMPKVPIDRKRLCREGYHAFKEFNDDSRCGVCKKTIDECVEQERMSVFGRSKR